jgi:hypothetical protein
MGYANVTPNRVRNAVDKLATYQCLHDRTNVFAVYSI